MKRQPILLGALIVASVACRLPAADDEGQAIALVQPGSLIGWTDGPTPPVGWKISDSVLSGSADLAPLLAGWTFGDFELRFDWSVSPGGSIQLSFPAAAPLKDRIPDRFITPEFRVTLSEDAAGATAFDGPRLVGRSEQPIRRADKHTAVLRRKGERLSLAIDGATQFDAAIVPSDRRGLRLSITEGTGTIGKLRAIEPAGDPLFNGEDLSGWTTSDPPGVWTWSNGELVCNGGGRDYLRTQRQYGNFTLAFEYNLSRRGNSGVGIRTPTEGWPSGDGIELQLYDEPASTPLNRHSNMAMYGNMEPLARAEKAGEWNRAVIKAQGYVISAWINGVLVQHANTYWLPELKHRNLQGWIGLQDHRSPVRFRHLTLLPGGDGRGLEAWYSPRQESAAQVVLDRVMNSERLSRQDGVRARSLVHQAKSAEAETIAELTGPGAVLELSATGPRAAQNQVGLYFDGESEPRLKGRLHELVRKTPSQAETSPPLFTFLPFRSSLKIVATGSPAEYRVETVQLTPELAVDSFQPDRESIDRGWLPAISRRLDQMDSGRLRDFAPYPLAKAEQRSIESGAKVELLAIPGEGVVDWLKLWISPKLLDNENLWTAIYVDGESEAAIAAPAKFLFPGLVQERDWHNFTLANSEGPTLRLAMPFTGGLRLVVENRGQSPIEGVGAVASVLPADRVTGGIAGRARLRALFNDGSKPGDQVFAIDGHGRWVGLVIEAKHGVGNGGLSLVVDGQATPSWAPSLAGFFDAARNTETRQPSSGWAGDLAWRYLLLAPIEFDKSLRLSVTGEPAPRSLALFYLYP